MMFDVVAPVILGASIGYVTNWLAIKMLFWPRGEKRILGFKVPFTPGLFVRRRQDFSLEASKLIESKFTNADDLYAMVQRAEDNGLMGKFLESLHPVIRLALRTYMRKTTAAEFREDCRRVALGLRRARVVSNTVRRKIDDMPVVDIEMMILVVVQRELQAITWLGAALGAVIGGLQILL